MVNTITTPKGLVTIRTGQSADVHAYRTLRLEALHNHPTAFSADHHANESQPLAFWNGRLQALDETNTLLFATHQDNLIGMCGIRRGDSPKTSHQAFIWGVYVQAYWRSHHIAEALVQNCLDWARHHAVKYVKIGVITTNTPAIRCYARCGFRVYGVENMAIYYDGVMYDELLMAQVIEQDGT